MHYEDPRYVNRGFARLNHANFDLIKNPRQDSQSEETYNPVTGRKEGQQVVSVESRTKSNYEVIAGSMRRVENSRLNQTDRMIPDVSVKRGLSEKLSSSKIRRDIKGPLINQDLQKYKQMVREKIHKYNDEINRSYVGNERQYLGVQTAQPVQNPIFGGINTNQNQPQLSGNILNSMYSQLGQRYGVNTSGLIKS
jgi:hypothetical protein